MTAKPKPTALKRLRDALREAQTVNDELIRDLAAIATEGRQQRREMRRLQTLLTMRKSQFDAERAFLQRQLKYKDDSIEQLRAQLTEATGGNYARCGDCGRVVIGVDVPAAEEVTVKTASQFDVNAGCQFDGGGE